MILSRSCALKAAQSCSRAERISDVFIGFPFAPVPNFPRPAQFAALAWSPARAHDADPPSQSTEPAPLSVERAPCGSSPSQFLHSESGVPDFGHVPNLDAV